MIGTQLAAHRQGDFVPPSGNSGNCFHDYSWVSLWEVVMTGRIQEEEKRGEVQVPAYRVVLNALPWRLSREPVPRPRAPVLSGRREDWLWDC